VPLVKLLDEQHAKNSISFLPIEVSHILKLDELPFHHKDPFDRLLIAQALQEKVTLLSADSIFSEYSVFRFW